MQTKTGDVLILKLVEARNSPNETVLYKVETENFKGDKYSKPVIEGTFIEVEVMRNFRVTKKSEYLTEELDPKPEENS